MKTPRLRASIGILLLAWASLGRAQTQIDPGYPIHDRNRPLPAVVVPASPSSQARAGRAPSDATVLFDGKDLSKWQMKDGSPAKWKLGNGYSEVVPESGYLYTREAFGDCQDQGRGNSGVFLQGLYEVQVLDSYRNPTYPDGQAGAIYGQFPPLVNASRAPGEWQSYDIVFHGPRFDAAGKLTRPARMTVLHNGVLVQDDVVLSGPTERQKRPPYVAGPRKLALALQDHHDPVRFRNVWIREIPDPARR